MIYLYHNVKFVKTILILEPHTHSIFRFQEHLCTHTCESINLGMFAIIMDEHYA